MKNFMMVLFNFKNYRGLISTIGLIAILLSNTIIVRPQNSNTQTNLRGQTQEVLVIPGTTTNAGEVKFVSDRDHDGMPDEDEIRNGTDPDDPSDADGDLDGDGLTNGDEVARGTDPNLADSDGDGVSDAEEIRLGYNPLDPNSTPPPNTALVSLQVTPNPLGLTVNTIFGAAPAQLTVTGITNTGTTVNLTNAANTVYQSLNQTVAVVSAAGSVFGISTGTATIRVQNGNLTANATVNVATFDPSPLSAIEIPGYANNVEVSGNYAYIAAGSAGLQIVDVADRNNPQIVASLDTSGNAIDVRIAGNFAYIADGDSGLQIINIADPLNPVLTGTVNTPGVAQDVAVRNQRVFVADGNSGMQIIDVSNPAAPVIIGSVDTPYAARGVDVSGNYAVIADDYQSYLSALRIIDISNPAAPQIVGNVNLSANAKDVVVRGNLAFVAAFVGGLQIVDFSNPGLPVVVGQLSLGDPGGFVPRDIELQDDFAFAAEQYFGNAVPIVNITNPANPDYRGVIDFSSIDDYAGTGISLDSEYVYMTGERYYVADDFGVSGDTKLFIGRHKILNGDTGTVAPTVNLTSPTDQQSVREGKELYLSATAADDVYVAGVQFKINGNIVETDSSRPYEFYYQVPLDATTLSVTATAFDLAGNSSTTPAITVPVTPDTPPTVSILSPPENSTLIEGENITLSADASDDEYVTHLRFSANAAEVADLYYEPYQTPLTVPEGINSLTIEAAATDTIERTTTVSRTLNVIPDPQTTVSGRVLTASGQPVADAAITVFDSFTAQTASDGTFTIFNVPTVRGDIVVKATALLNNTSAANASLPFAPARGGTTNVGDIKLRVGSTAPTAVSIGYFGNRDDNVFYGQDLFVSYNDRLSSVYSFNGTEFVPRTVGQMETGAAASGTSSSVTPANLYGDNLIFLQLAGQPGFFNKFNADNRENITRTSLANNLSSEAKFMSIGRDYATGEDVVAFLSNDEPGGAVIKIKVGGEEPLTVPLPSAAALNSLVLNDLDNNGFTDILAVRSLPNGEAKLITIKRNSAQPPEQFVDTGSFEPAFESDIIERVADPSNGLNNLAVGNFAPTSGKEVAVLGDDRVRIYNFFSGQFVLEEEVLLPAGEIPTGLLGYSLKNSSYTDLLITTKNANTPESHSLFVYFNGAGGGGCGNCSFTSPKNDKNSKTESGQDLFNGPTTRTYTISNSSGDSRIVVGNWGGAYNRLDVVVIEGDEVKIFFDVTPVISGS